MKKVSLVLMILSLTMIARVGQGFAQILKTDISPDETFDTAKDGAAHRAKYKEGLDAYQQMICDQETLDNVSKKLKEANYPFSSIKNGRVQIGWKLVAIKCFYKPEAPNELFEKSDEEVKKHLPVLIANTIMRTSVLLNNASRSRRDAYLSQSVLQYVDSIAIEVRKASDAEDPRGNKFPPIYPVIDNTFGTAVTLHRVAYYYEGQELSYFIAQTIDKKWIAEVDGNLRHIFLDDPGHYDSILLAARHKLPQEFKPRNEFYVPVNEQTLEWKK